MTFFFLKKKLIKKKFTSKIAGLLDNDCPNISPFEFTIAAPVSSQLVSIPKILKFPFFF